MPDDYFVPKQRLRQEGGPYHPDYALKLAQRGLFPLPVRLSSRKVGWMKSAIVQYLKARAA